MPRLRTKQWCNHYRGMHEKQECEAGIRFDSLPHYGTREFMDNCPCFGPRGTAHHGSRFQRDQPSMLFENAQRRPSLRALAQRVRSKPHHIAHQRWSLGAIGRERRREFVTFHPNDRANMGDGDLRIGSHAPIIRR